MKTPFFRWVSLLLALTFLVASCTPAPATPAPREATSPPAVAIDCGGAAAGDTVTMMSQWTGAEEEKINAILAPFSEACGVEIVAESTRDEAVLDTRVKSDPPDILFWPSQSPAQLYTAQLQDLASVGAHTENYADFWVDQGTVNGRLLVVPAKADIKTLIWYSPAQFEAFGYTVPTTFDELDALVGQMVADGNIPWSVGFGTGPA